MSHGNRVAHARTLLFVPGDREDRFGRAMVSGADGVILDLEDAVAANGKDRARRAVRAWLADHPEAVVRINPPGSAWYEADVEALVGVARTVMLPKAEPESVGRLRGDLSVACDVVALVETSGGVQDARAIALADGVVRLALGHMDLAAELGVDPDAAPILDHARMSLAIASASASLPQPLDGVTMAISDEGALVRDSLRARSLGFGGKLCIHPRQVGLVHSALAPTAEEVERARKVVRAATEGAVTVLDGRMIDKPVLDHARRVLERISEPTAPAGSPEDRA